MQLIDQQAGFYWLEVLGRSVDACMHALCAFSCNLLLRINHTLKYETINSCKRFGGEAENFVGEAPPPWIEP